MPEGATLAEMIEAAQLDPILHRYCHVEIDGVPVDPTKLHLIRPKAGHLVTVRAVPGKSAKKAIGGVAGGGGGAPGLGGQVRRVPAGVHGAPARGAEAVLLYSMPVLCYT
jgi:hypothetical protein